MRAHPDDGPIARARRARLKAEQRRRDEQILHDMRLQKTHDAMRGDSVGAAAWQRIEDHMHTLERHGVGRSDAAREAARLRRDDG